YVYLVGVELGKRLHRGEGLVLLALAAEGSGHARRYDERARVERERLAVFVHGGFEPPPFAEKVAEAGMVAGLFVVDVDEVFAAVGFFFRVLHYPDALYLDAWYHLAEVLAFEVGPPRRHEVAEGKPRDFLYRSFVIVSLSHGVEE